jgi:hypothetical protein
VETPSNPEVVAKDLAGLGTVSQKWSKAPRIGQVSEEAGRVKEAPLSKDLYNPQ